MNGVRFFCDTADALRKEARLLTRVAQCESDRENLLWTGGRSLVAPSSIRHHPQFEFAVRNSIARGWPVELRPSGGGIVPQGPGILNLALVQVTNTAQSRDSVYFYRVLTDVIARAVDCPDAVSVGSIAGSFCDGKYNVAAKGRKLAGTAQRWTSRRDGSGDYAVLAHAVILCAADISACCAAINDFCSGLGVLSAFNPRAHINLQELLPDNRDAIEHFASMVGIHEAEPAALN